jgi:hypothetical protein
MKQVFTNPPYMNLFFTIGELNLNYTNQPTVIMPAVVLIVLVKKTTLFEIVENPSHSSLPS